MYIAGQLVDAEDGSKSKVTCPATEEIIAETAQAKAQDAEKALISAKKGFTYWSNLSLAERTEWMLQFRKEILDNQELLRKAIIYETGKTYGQSWEDIELLVNALEWYPETMKNYREEEIPDYENTHHHVMVSQPAGVVVAYLAWNFPLLNVAYKLGPALAAGCSIILKPSPYTPLTTYMLGELMHRINFPEGVVNIIAGPDKEVGTALSNSTIPSTITMIGSTSSARQVIADSNTSIKRFSMELGGNAPFIVFDDADIDKALNIGILLKYGNCGQVCVAVNRFFVHKNIYDTFLKEFIKRANDLRLGFGMKEDYDMGPLITRSARDKMFDLINEAVSKGAKLETGGKIPEGKENGNWLEPTVLSNVNSDMRIFREEIFGPVAPIMSFETDEEVLELANDVEHGLASYIFTNSHDRIIKFSEKLEFGEVQVNGVKYCIYLPHGGIKNSGMGHDCSHLALREYLIKKRISTAKS